MFQLAVETDSRWAVDVVQNLDELLLEHAHLERKAAASALQNMIRYTEHESLQQPLSELAREELRHFEAVLGELSRRGLSFGKQQPSPYAARLLSIVRKHEPAKLLDRLLCSAVIEARSCERMKLLAGAVRCHDSSLATFYDDLVRSEARHYRTYLELAERVFSADEVKARMTEICVHEAGILGSTPDGPRMHSGVPGDATA